MQTHTETSLASRSQSEKSHRSEIGPSKEGLLSANLDPLYDFITQFTNVPQIFYFIFVIWLSLQMVFISTWANNHSGAWYENFINIFSILATFRKPSETVSQMLTDFCGYTAVVVVLLLFVAFQLTFFKFQRRFSKITLYPTRLVLEIIAPLMLTPIGHFIGILFFKICTKSDENKTVIYFIFAISIVEFIIIVAFVIYTISNIGISPYLSKSPISAFDYRPYLFFVIATPAFTLGSYIFQYFPYWAMHPLVLLHFLAYLYNFIQLCYQPFISHYWNAYFMFIDFFLVLLDVYKIITQFLGLKSNVVTASQLHFASLIIFFVLMAISIAVATLVSVLRYRKLIQILCPIHIDIDSNEDYTIPNDERLAIFEKLNLHTSESFSLSILYFVIRNNVIPYLDFFLLKFIIGNYKSSFCALMQCMRIVAYFPPNSRYLNILFNEANRMRGLNTTQNFFLFQVQKIKLLRQSASSTQAGERLKELKSCTKELETDIHQFWFKNEKSACNITYLIKIHQKMSKYKALWNEALMDFPNSIPYRDEYSRFAIECATDFTEAIRNKHKSDMIESGKNFNVDMCFRKFISVFPLYLKKNIIDIKGNYIRENKKHGKGSMSSNGLSKQSFSNASSSSNSIDAQVEEGIGRSLVTQAKIRLALQHSTEEKKANKFYPMIVVTLLLFFFGFFVSLIMFLKYQNNFDDRTDSTERVELKNKARLYLYTSGVMALYHWGNMTDQIDIEELSQRLNQIDGENEDEPYLPTPFYKENINIFNVMGRDSFSKFLRKVASQSNIGVNMYKYASTLFEETIPLRYCTSTEVMPAEHYNLKTIILFIFIQQSLLPEEPNPINWFMESRRYCNMLTNLLTVFEAFKHTRLTLTELANSIALEQDAYIGKLKIGLTVSYGVITVILSIFFSYLYCHEIHLFVRMLNSLPKEVKKSSAKSIRKDSIDEEDISFEKDTLNTTDVSNSGGSSRSTEGTTFSIPILYNVIICTLLIVVVILIYMQLDNIDNHNLKFRHLNQWTANSRLRKTLIMQIMMWIMHSIISENIYVDGSFFIYRENFTALIERDFHELDKSTKNMLDDSLEYPSSNGMDSLIDELTYREVCFPNKTNPSYHEMYRCGSVQNLLNFFLNTISEIQVNLLRYNNTVKDTKDEIPAQLLHLSVNHVIPKLIRIDNQWEKVSIKFTSEFKTRNVVFFGCELLVVLIVLILMISEIYTLSNAYKVCLSLLRRISPINICNDTDLVNYLLDKSSNKDSNVMSTDQGIIHNSSDSIFCISQLGLIEIINPAVSKMLGFTPEQLLGQPISSVFSDDYGAKVEHEIELMRNHHRSLTYEDHTVCITDDDSKIPCALTILGMTNNYAVNNANNENHIRNVESDHSSNTMDHSSSDVESFVIILKNEEEIVIQQKEAEKAKKQSETLLYQILPRDIVIRLNQGEKDISFSVPSSTIMFVDIVKFSEYAVSLTPQEIMGNLSLIFAGFDECITKFALLLKIKLIGDVYMCAGGLFAPDEPPISHAEQMTRFGLECLQVLEDVNVKLNAILNVRIGINTGGPLIAGVLGTDKLTFDIIGDPINIASRLQSTDYPGRIQISQNTYDLVKGLDFHVEPRGEVFLKGKGNQTAYFVSQMRMIIQQTSGQDILMN